MVRTICVIGAAIIELYTSLSYHDFMTVGFQVRGDSNNPYHLSIGTVVTDEEKIALVKKPSGIYTLPRETVYSDESIEDALNRGIEEELGVLVNIIKFLGTQITYFDRPDGTSVEKTTIYFLANKTGETSKNQAEDELDDAIEWFESNEAIKILKEQSNMEFKLIERVI